MDTGSEGSIVVLVYPGQKSLLERSGVGTARRNHSTAVERLGLIVTSDLRQSFDVLHVHSWQFGAAKWIRRARARGAAVVVSVHNTSHDFGDSLVGSNLLEPLFRRWSRWLYGQADVLLSPSEIVSARVREMSLSNEIVQVSGGYDAGIFMQREEGLVQAFLGTGVAGRIPPSKPVILGVGNTFQRKGFVDFVKMARQMPEATFVWCGPIWRALAGPTVAWSIVARPNNLFLTGFVDQFKLSQIMNAASAYTALSHEESEGLALVEAIACGLPVVARDLDAYSAIPSSEHVIRLAKSSTAREAVVALRALTTGRSHPHYHLPTMVSERSLDQIGPTIVAAYRAAVDLRTARAKLDG